MRPSVGRWWDEKESTKDERHDTQLFKDIDPSIEFLVLFGESSQKTSELVRTVQKEGGKDLAAWQHHHDWQVDGCDVKEGEEKEHCLRISLSSSKWPVSRSLFPAFLYVQELTSHQVEGERHQLYVTREGERCREMDSPVNSYEHTRRERRWRVSLNCPSLSLSFQRRGRTNGQSFAVVDDDTFRQRRRKNDQRYRILWREGIHFLRQHDRENRTVKQFFVKSLRYDNWQPMRNNILFLTSKIKGSFLENNRIVERKTIVYTTNHHFHVLELLFWKDKQTQKENNGRDERMGWWG